MIAPALADLSPRVRDLIARAPDPAQRREEIEREARRLRIAAWWAAQWREEEAARDRDERADFYAAVDEGRDALARAGLFASKGADMLPPYSDREAARRWSWHRRRALLTLFADAQAPAELAAAYRAAAVYLSRHGVEVPAPKRGAHMTGRGTLAACVRRLLSDRWLTRAGQKAANRRGEAAAIEAGRVHSRAGFAVSDAAVDCVREARAAGAAALAQMNLVCEETGEFFPLAEVQARSVANPAIRRGELMTRIKGCEKIATAAGHRCLFVTWTLASRYHARLESNGAANPRHDPELSPRDGQSSLCQQWARVRSRLAKRGLSCYGFRAAEPHHDGCPHWHLWLFVRRIGDDGRELASDARDLATVRREIRREALKEGASDPGAAKRRATFKTLDVRDGGGPAAYAAKYVCKAARDGGAGAIERGESLTADGERIDAGAAADHAERIAAWARLWGFRQFQFFGTAPVGIWREARRIREPLQGDLFIFEATRAAADAGDWQAFTAAMQAARVGLAHEPQPVDYCPLNEYGERAAARVHGLAAPDLAPVELPPRRRRRAARVRIRDAAPGIKRDPLRWSGLRAALARRLVERVAITRPLHWSIQWGGAGPAAGATAGRTGATVAPEPPWTRGNNCNPPH